MIFPCRFLLSRWRISFVGVFLSHPHIQNMELVSSTLSFVASHISGVSSAAWSSNFDRGDVVICGEILFACHATSCSVGS